MDYINCIASVKIKQIGITYWKEQVGTSQASQVFASGIMLDFIYLDIYFILFYFIESEGLHANANSTGGS